MPIPLWSISLLLWSYICKFIFCIRDFLVFVYVVFVFIFVFEPVHHKKWDCCCCLIRSRTGTSVSSPSVGRSVGTCKYYCWLHVFVFFVLVFSSGVDRLEPVSIFVDFVNLYFSICIFQWGSFGFTSCVVPHVRHVPFISFVWNHLTLCRVQPNIKSGSLSF